MVFKFANNFIANLAIYLLLFYAGSLLATVGGAVLLGIGKAIILSINSSTDVSFMDSAILFLGVTVGANLIVLIPAGLIYGSNALGSIVINLLGFLFGNTELQTATIQFVPNYVADNLIYNAQQLISDLLATL